MRILILTNFDVGLYQFRRELIQELLTKNEVYIYPSPTGNWWRRWWRWGAFFSTRPWNGGA